MKHQLESNSRPKTKTEAVSTPSGLPETFHLILLGLIQRVGWEKLNCQCKPHVKCHVLDVHNVSIMFHIFIYPVLSQSWLNCIPFPLEIYRHPLLLRVMCLAKEKSLEQQNQDVILVPKVYSLTLPGGGFVALGKSMSPIFHL